MMDTPRPLGDARFFAHEAMRTEFAIRVAGRPESELRGIARECFELVDRIESLLSRYREGSDVWRINHLSAGETLYLSDECHRCLLRALDGHRRTGGLFDITIGTWIEHRKRAGDGPMPPLRGRLVVDPEVPAVSCLEEGREIDLGGIGKGFALDEVASLLGDWEVDNVLLTAGASSMKAIGTMPWPVALACEQGSVEIQLTNEALSASGTGIQGAHIVHPGATEASGAECFRRVWVSAPDAAMAEIWSTSIMLVPPSEILEWLADGGGFGRVFVEDASGVREIPTNE